MLHILEAQSMLMLVVDLVLLGVKLFAFVSSLLYSSESYNAANKLNKPTWTVILGLGLVVQVVMGGPLILSLVFIIAAFVYLADVRPALASLTRR